MAGACPAELEMLKTLVEAVLAVDAPCRSMLWVGAWVQVYAGR